jgi:hypothetical protein
MNKPNTVGFAVTLYARIKIFSDTESNCVPRIMSPLCRSIYYVGVSGDGRACPGIFEQYPLVPQYAPHRGHTSSSLIIIPI